MNLADELRGEVDIELDGQRFVLRPSWQAVRKIESMLGRALIPLAMQAEQSALNQDELAIIVAEMVRAWGQSLQVDDATPLIDRANASAARGVNAERIGELLYSVGVMNVMPRVSLVLGLAVSGGCLPSGELKTVGTTMIPETPAVESLDSPAPVSGGQPTSSG